MKKIAIVLSSFSGKYDKEVVEAGMFSIPLQLIIDNNEWLEGFYDEKQRQEIVDRFVNANDYKTSLPPLALILDQMEELSKNFDDVLYIPLDAQLSSTCDTLMNYAKNYKNVHVFNNHLSGSALFHVGLKAKQMYEKENKNIDEIITYLKWFDENTIGYIIPKELKTFIKSGRLKGIKKALMTSINLSLMIEVGKVLKTTGVARTKKSAIVKVINRIIEFMSEKNLKADDVDFTLIWAHEESIALIVSDVLENEFNLKIKYNEKSSLVTMLHTGYGAIYIGINPKIS